MQIESKIHLHQTVVYEFCFGVQISKYAYGVNVFQLKKQFPTMNLKIPAKRIFGDNFDPGKL